MAAEQPETGGWPRGQGLGASSKRRALSEVSWPGTSGARGLRCCGGAGTDGSAHGRRPVIQDAPGGESDPGFCVHGENAGVAVTRHSVPVRPPPSRDPPRREGREHAPSRGDAEARLAEDCWHQRLRSESSPGSLEPEFRQGWHFGSQTC